MFNPHAPTKFSGEAWARHHEEALLAPLHHERAILTIARGLEQYAEEHRGRYDDTPIGEDYVLGCAFEDIARGLLMLLNGEIGRLDGGTVDAAIRSMCAKHGVELS